MLIVALVASVAPGSDVGLIFGALGALALLTSAGVVVFGQRNKTMATQQDFTIHALKDRLDLVEAENKENRAKVSVAEGKIEVLTEVASSKQEIVKGFVALGVSPSVFNGK